MKLDLELPNSQLPGDRLVDRLGPGGAFPCSSQGNGDRPRGPDPSWVRYPWIDLTGLTLRRKHNGDAAPIDLERLTAFSAGLLDEAGEAEVQAHLSTCAGCCRRAANLPEDPFAAEVRAACSSFSSLSWGGGLSAATTTTTDGGGVPSQIGDFHLLREAGRGGMGIVYEAVQQSLGRHIALKVLPPNAVLDPRYLHRFRREAQAVARLHHPNIAPVFGVGEEGGVHYYAMQFIRGRGLDQVLQDARAGDGRNTLRSLLLTARDGPPPRDADLYRRLAEVSRQVAEALDYAHGQGVLHRDVKPSNILIDSNGHAWVTDFGLAKLAGEGEELTATGDLIGTLRYMAPERLQGQGDARSDVYSLGLTLYELATVRPWSASTSGPSDAIRQALDGQTPRPRRLNPKLPRDLETVILKATAAEQSHRYATARDLADDLGRFIEDRPVLASRTSLPRRLAEILGPGVSALAGLIALAALAALLTALAGVSSSP